MWPFEHGGVLPFSFEPHGIGRRAFLRAFLLSAFAAQPALAQIEAEAVPLELQIQLLQKIVRYDQNFLSRAAGRVKTLIVVDGDQPDSARAGQTARAILREQKELGGLPHEEQILVYVNAQAVRRAVDAGRVSIVYLMRGIGKRAQEVSAELSGANVLSVSAIPTHVPTGIVLGFDLVSSQPKLLTNLTAAQRQGVAFQAQAIRLMKVYR